MDSSGYWDNYNPSFNINNDEYQQNSSNVFNNSSINVIAASSQHLLLTQEAISHEEIIDSIASASVTDNHNYIHNEEDEDAEDAEPEDLGTNLASNITSATDQPTLEQIQKVYYAKGLEELESLHLLDLSPLANWKLSSYKQDFGLVQLREDSPDTYWQSDGTNGNNSNSNAITNNQLSNPHTVTIQFSKKVSLERISIFINYSLDESYTPSKIKIMAGSSDGWDLSEVCTVNFNKPIGWSHIIFNGIRDDGVLKCFMVKLIILANHQDGKDSHIRAIRCFGRKSTVSKNTLMGFNKNDDILKDITLAGSVSNASGFSLNDDIAGSFVEKVSEEEECNSMNDVKAENNKKSASNKRNVSKIVDNVADIIGFNSGFQSFEMKKTSSIR